MTLEFRGLSTDMLEDADRIAMAAYGTASRRGELQRYLAVQPDGWLLAVLDGRPVGLGGAINYGQFAYIGMVSVLPDYQHRGIGRAIMVKLLEILESWNCSMARLDASPAGAPIYASLEFTRDDDVWVLIPESPTPLHAAEATDVHVRDLTSGDMPALIEFDRPKFGAARPSILVSLQRDWPGRVFVALGGDGTFSGFIFASPQKLGPWVATTPLVAEALLAHALAMPEMDAPTVLMPAVNSSGLTLLDRCGFVRQRMLTHMRLGGTGVPGMREQIYGLASFALG